MLNEKRGLFSLDIDDRVFEYAEIEYPNGEYKGTIDIYSRNEDGFGR